jgi:hypothetical protein
MSYKRKRDENRRLRKLYEQTHKHSYAFGGAWYNPRKGRYVRVTSSNRSGYPKRLRQMCNKRIRRTRDIPNGSAYKKVSEYQYLLF